VISIYLMTTENALAQLQEHSGALLETYLQKLSWSYADVDKHTGSKVERF